MTQRGSDAAPGRQLDLSPEVKHILWPALKVGSFSGFSGLLVGSFAGIARSNHPAIFAMACSIQCFTVGATFWATRATFLHTWDEDKVKPKDKILASSIAGCVGGSFGGLSRSKGSVIPGAIMFAILGAGGQKIYNILDSRRLDEAKPAKARWLDSKWSPVKALTEEDYKKRLQEKLLQVNADIAIIDDNIEAIRSQEAERKASQEATDKSNT